MKYKQNSIMYMVKCDDGVYEHNSLVETMEEVVDMVQDTSSDMRVEEVIKVQILQEYKLLPTLIEDNPEKTMEWTDVERKRGEEEVAELIAEDEDICTICSRSDHSTKECPEVTLL